MRSLIPLIKNNVLKIKDKIRRKIYPSMDKQINMISQQPLKSTELKTYYEDYLLLDDYIINFMNSKSIAGRVNGQHLTFIIGAQNSGKTDFVNKNIKIFKEMKRQNQKIRKNTKIQYTILKTPQLLEQLQKQQLFDNEYYLVADFDFHNNHMLTFQGFLHVFHERIKNQIYQLNKKFRTQQLLNVDIIKQITLMSKTPQYLFIYIKDALYAILHDNDPIFLPEEKKKLLEEYNQTIKQLASDEYFKGNHFNILIDILSEQCGYKNQVACCIDFLLSVMKRIQYQYRPQIYKQSWFESGFESTSFLFDILNHICGFGPLNYRLMKSYYENQQQYTKFTQKYKNNYIFNGNHVDVVISLLNIAELDCFETKQFQDFYDNLLIRVNNYSNLRTHFPIIIELKDTIHLRKIHNLGRMSVDNPGILQIPGYFQYTINEHTITKILNKTTINKLFKVLGRLPSTWNQAIQILCDGYQLQDILYGQIPLYKQKKIIFEAKINSTFLHPQNISKLDKGIMQVQLLHYMIMLDKCQRHFKTSTYYYYSIFNQSSFQSLQKQGLVFDHFYLNAMELAYGPFMFPMKDKIHQWKKKYRWRYLYLRLSARLIYRKPDLIYFNNWFETSLFKYYKFPRNRMDYLIRFYYGPNDVYKLRYMHDIILAKDIR